MDKENLFNFLHLPYMNNKINDDCIIPDRSNEIDLRGIPGIKTYAPPLTIHVNYEWIISEVERRLAKENWNNKAWNDAKSCLRELDKEQRDG
jgi:hypothetical protein